MDIGEKFKKSVDIAVDLTKQLIALSTAIISLCVAFTDKVFSSHAAQTHAWLLVVALSCFVLSIIAGIFVLMRIAGHLGNPKDEKDTPKQSLIYECNVRRSSIIQLFSFAIALVFAMIFVWKAASTSEEKQEDLGNSDKMLKIIRVSDYSIEKCQVTDTLLVDPMNIE